MTDAAVPRWRRADLPLELSLGATSLAATLGALRLVDHPPASLAWSVLAVVVAGHSVTALARRLPPPAPAPLAWGLLAVVVTSWWTVLGSSTWWGVPTLTTARAAADRLGQAMHVLDGRSTPLPAAPGIVFVFVLLAGVVAVTGRAILALVQDSPRWRRRKLLCLVPSFTLFVYTAVLSSGRERISATFAYLLGAVAYVAAAESASAHARAERWIRLGPGLALAFMAWFVAVVASGVPAVGAINLRVFVHVVNAGPGASGGTVPGASQNISGLALIDNLAAVETSRSDAIAFVTTSPVPTYWQVGTLTSFDGTRWRPDAATARVEGLGRHAAARRTAPNLPQPLLAPHGDFDASVSLETLRSQLLPVPPGAIGVGTGGGDVVELDPPVGAVLLDPAAAAGHLHYNVEAPQPVTSDELVGLPGVAADPATSVPSAAVEPYLELPTMPADVVALAHRIVRDASTPAGAVLALDDWFTSGAYRYTLNPPPLHGRNPLTTFLFSTRAGFCQQFAGAFGVLARIDGLPTRIAVGFTPGQPVGDGRYLVSAIDAHVWPQVYLGPGAGWISVDPTPGDGTGLGPTPGALSTGSPVSGDGLQNVRHPQSANKATHTPTTVPGTVSHHGVFSGNAGRRDGLLVAIVAVAMAAVAGTIALLRRWTRRAGGSMRRPLRRPLPALRRRPDRLAATDAKVLHSWRRAAGGLDHVGLGRRATESPTEHARRLRHLDGGPSAAGSGRPVAARDRPGLTTAIASYADLAELAARASYAAEPCNDADVSRARDLADAVTAGSRHVPRVPAGVAGRPGHADDPSDGALEGAPLD
jgi:hypothetical protein